MKEILVIIVLALSISACRKGDLIDDTTLGLGEEIEIETPDWNDVTHSNSATPDYSVVFNQNEIIRFDIKIDSEHWSVMQSDLAYNLGTSGGPGNMTSDFDPVWVPCSFNFNGTEWSKVGIRFKGNSSLMSAYRSGNNKLSFKLDFDEFEDNYPAIKNQRFYGFKQLNLNNNFEDASLIREKVASDLFREFGLVASQTTFCVLYVDNGSGPQYYGVYTIVEEMDDTVLKSQLGDDSGNLYKPDGDAASFAINTYDESEMEKKNNEDLEDYSDVKALYDIINSDLRTSNTALWKVNLSEVFNVDIFLKWLAANTVIQNWDTYGRMTHNFYLYNNPDDNLLCWIPWDNNEALQEGKQGGALSLSMNEVGSNWPLINYLVADDEYRQIYESYLNQFVINVFIPSKMETIYSNYFELLKNYAYAEESGYTFINSSSSFDQAIEALKLHVQERNDAVVSFLF